MGVEDMEMEAMEVEDMEMEAMEVEDMLGYMEMEAPSMEVDMKLEVELDLELCMELMHQDLELISQAVEVAVKRWLAVEVELYLELELETAIWQSQVEMRQELEVEVTVKRWLAVEVEMHQELELISQAVEVTVKRWLAVEVELCLELELELYLELDCRHQNHTGQTGQSRSNEPPRYRRSLHLRAHRRRRAQQNGRHQCLHRGGFVESKILHGAKLSGSQNYD